MNVSGLERIMLRQARCDFCKFAKMTLKDENVERPLEICVKVDVMTILAMRAGRNFYGILMPNRKCVQNHWWEQYFERTHVSKKQNC